MRLPSPKVAAAHAAGSGDPGAPLAEARRARRAVFIMLLRRYYGVVLGGLLSAFCIWFMLYRVMRGMYPWPVDLLQTGLRADELEVIRKVRELLP
jgi:hypothetical protein